MVNNGMQNARQNYIDLGNDVTTPCGLKAGHVVRMPEHRLPQRLFCGVLKHGKRAHCGKK